jgi:hypothetical protein
LLPVDRARLLRWLAAEVLLVDPRADRAEALLRTARSLAPHDAKTAGLASLMKANAGLARRVLWAWRQTRTASRWQ